MPVDHGVAPVILAGGFGTRVRPLSANLPKPLLPVVNRPIVAHVVSHLASHGFTEAIVLTYHQSGAIRQALGDGGRLGVRLRYLDAGEDLGTAGAVAWSLSHLDAARVLVLSADVVTEMDLGAILASHERQSAQATIALTRVANPLQLGIVIVDADGRVRRFLEKPTWGEVFSDTVNAGVFVLERGVFDAVPPGEPFDFASDLFPRLLATGRPVHGFVAPGYWRDVGDPESYLAVHRDFFHGDVRLPVAGVCRLVGARQVWIEGSAAIDASAELRGTVVLGPGCEIGAGTRVEDAVLGPRTVVGSRAYLRGTITWEDARIGDDTRVEHAVLGARVRVGRGTVVEEGAVVADDTSLGEAVRVKQGVKIWPSKVVEDHAVVHSNLVHAERWRTSTFEEGAVTGLTNLELTPEVAARLGAAYATLLPAGSTVLSVRDAHPASRMLRRAFVGGVGSAGVNMVDLGLVPLPVMRHKLEAFGEIGGVAFSQVHLVRGMTSIRFFDDHGLDISTGLAKSIERVFLREEFRRVQHAEIGAIFELPRILDFYSEAYLKALDAEAIRARRFRLVVDYGHSAAVVVLPRLLADLNCDVVTLNAHLEGVHEALLPDEVDLAHRRLAAIVTSLEADLGVWLHPSGERLVLVDPRQKTWSGMDLVGLAVAAVALAGLPPAEVALPAYAPSGFSRVLAGAGHRVQETLSAPRALTEASRRRDVVFVTAGEGDFIFPALGHTPDALFALGALLGLFARVEGGVSRAVAEAPAVPVASVSVPCPLERKGEVMRRFLERVSGRELSYLEGVKVSLDGGWLLLRPDRVAPRLHLHAEAATREAARDLVEEHQAAVEALVRTG